MPDMPGTQKLCFKFICCNFAYVYNEVFACGTHIPQHICLEESYDTLFSYFHKIHAGTYKNLMHKKVHLMSCRIICRKRKLQKGGIMWKGVRMTWMVRLKSSIMLNYCFHCHKNENVETWDRDSVIISVLPTDTSLCPAQATFPVMWASNLIMEKELSTSRNYMLDLLY